MKPDKRPQHIKYYERTHLRKTPLDQPTDWIGMSLRSVRNE